MKSARHLVATIACCIISSQSALAQESQQAKPKKQMIPPMLCLSNCGSLPRAAADAPASWSVAKVDGGESALGVVDDFPTSIATNGILKTITANPCIPVTLLKSPNAGQTVVFQRAFRAAENSTHVEVSFSASIVMYPPEPSSNATGYGLGVALDCNVAQDPMGGTNYTSSSPCSGITGSTPTTGAKPWVAFWPNPTGAGLFGLNTTFKGYVKVDPGLPTRVTVTYLGMDFTTGSTEAYSCNNNLVIAY